MSKLALTKNHAINNKENDFILKCFEQPILVYIYIYEMIHNNKIDQINDFKNHVIENYVERVYVMIKINESISPERQN